MALSWTNKVDGQDYVLAEDVNALAAAIIDNETAISGKQDALVFDDTPTANSDNPVKSSGIKTAVDAKLNAASPSFTGGITGVGAVSINRKSGTTIGNLSTAIGEETTASGNGAVAIGYKTSATKGAAFATGRETIANQTGQCVCGSFNVADDTKVFIVGYGTSTANRKNVFSVDTFGEGVFSGDCKIGTRSLKAVPVVFRIVGWETITLFCAAGTTWADIISGDANPFVHYFDHLTDDYYDGKLLMASSTYVRGITHFVEGFTDFQLYADDQAANTVLTTDTPSDGATYYISTE